MSGEQAGEDGFMWSSTQCYSNRYKSIFESSTRVPFSALFRFILTVLYADEGIKIFIRKQPH